MGGSVMTGGTDAGTDATDDVANDVANDAAGDAGTGGDPTTCAEAATKKTSVGCDFWPTVTANIVWSIFDYAVVVANTSASPAMVTVTGNGQNQNIDIGPGQLATVYLPWVASLKGPDGDACGDIVAPIGSVQAPGAAFHLVSSVPVAVYQFNALEYQGQGGPMGKSWAACPGTQVCATTLGPVGCFSFTNDASLLFPSTAMTGNYRVTGISGWSAAAVGATVTITGTQPNTNVKVTLPATGHVLAGGTIPETKGSGVLQFTVGTGDVVELLGAIDADNTGALVQADQPVQVIAGHPCSNVPQDVMYPACDHLEQSVLPAETLGKHYFVAPPTSPHAAVIGHVVRLVGNANGTTLTYPGTKPAGAPTTLSAGQVADLGTVTTPFEVVADHELAVVTFMLGASLADPNSMPPMQLGDPSQSDTIPVEQYRTSYVFVAPTDYTESYVDITAPTTAQVTLDGALVMTAATPISSGFGIARVTLGPGNGGAHEITSTEPVGIQVIGYGSYTSYQYPGGSNLAAIAPPPM
jgi:hypothetical protein